jgi:hypothetical protein
LDTLLEEVGATLGIEPGVSDVLPDAEVVEVTFGRLCDFVLAHVPVDRSDLSTPLAARVFVRLRNAISSATGRMGLDHSSALTDLVESPDLPDFWQQVELQTALRLPPLQRRWISLRADYMLPYGVATLGDLADYTTAINLRRLVEHDVGYRPDDVWAVLASLVRRSLTIGGPIVRSTRLL